MSSAKSVKSKKLKTGIELLKQFCNYLPRAKQPEWNCFFSTQHRICSGRFGVSLVLDSKIQDERNRNWENFRIFREIQVEARRIKNKNERRKKCSADFTKTSSKACLMAVVIMILNRWWFTQWQNAFQTEFGQAGWTYANVFQLVLRYL